jgi:hypothetical protein
MTKISLIRLLDDTGKKVEQFVQERGIAFATAVRCIVVDHMKEIASATAAKLVTDASCVLQDGGSK